MNSYTTDENTTFPVPSVLLSTRFLGLLACSPAMLGRFFPMLSSFNQSQTSKAICVVPLP